MEKACSESKLTASLVAGLAKPLVTAEGNFKQFPFHTPENANETIESHKCYLFRRWDVNKQKTMSLYGVE